ncbi:MAG: response regulator, partial [Phycisphaerales bacterium]
HVLGMIASTLDSLGYKVVLASDGVSVLEMAVHHGEDIRLLILDVDLPEKSGPDCVKALRERGLNTPAIMITGNVDFDAATLDHKTVLLRKPFGMPELAST